MARIALLSLAALAFLIAPAASATAKAKPRLVKCGSYTKSDGSLADSVVTDIKVVGMSCAAGQTVANGYSGLVGNFTTHGFKCLGVQANAPPQQAGSVRCVKGRKRMSYDNAPMTDCSTTPGIITQPGQPYLGPWTYNAGCDDAVAVINAGANGNGTPPLPAGWTCQGNNASGFVAGSSCNMRSGPTWEVVQWNYANASVPS
jgi:hypothetical protein